MFGNVIFRRFDKSSKIDGFLYEQNDNLRDFEHDLRAISLDKTGFNIYYNVRNYTAETVYIGGSLRTSPSQIRSLLRDDIRPDYAYHNQIVITIYNTVNVISPDPKKKTIHARKTEIRVPGRMLGQGSVFIGELDCYLMAESNIDATREGIAKDVSQQGWESISLPSSMIKQDPAQVYEGYKHLVKDCIERKDKISIRVGADLEYGNVPDIIKNMRVAILDSYFVPFTDYKLVYDPSLRLNEFVIENLHVTSQQEFTSTFAELQQRGSMYLDSNEEETLFGKFYGMALFADQDHYLDYVHQRKSQERFQEEMLYVADRSGDPLLKEKIGKLDTTIAQLEHHNEEKTEIITTLKETNKRLKLDLKDREEALTRIRDNHDVKMNADVIVSGIENERLKIHNDTKRISNETLEIKSKEETNRLNYRAAKFKTLAEILKSGWGITTASLGGIVSIVALCKKYNIRINMGA